MTCSKSDWYVCISPTGGGGGGAGRAADVAVTYCLRCHDPPWVSTITDAVSGALQA